MITIDQINAAIDQHNADADTLAAFPGDYYGSVSILCSLGSEYHRALSNLWSAK